MDSPDRQALNDALEEALGLADEGWTYAMDYYRTKWDYDGRFKALDAVLVASQTAQEAIQGPPPSKREAHELRQLREALLELIEWPRNASRPSSDELIQALLVWKVDMDPVSVLEDE
jgi:hypothetical protein